MLTPGEPVSRAGAQPAGIAALPVGRTASAGARGAGRTTEATVTAARRRRIAERLHQSGPTVSQTVARMERDGLLTVQGDRHLELTELGRHRAVSVMRKHRLAELLLVNVIGLEYEQAHAEACRWEHVMSDEVERKVYELLGRPHVSPYGNQIPGLSELDVAAEPDVVEPVMSLAIAPLDEPVVVRRISEQLQKDTLLIHQLHEAGVEPGAAVTVSR